MQQVTVSRRGPRELGATVGASCLRSLAGLLALVSQQVAECGELASVAAVLPAAGLRSALHNTDVACFLGDGTA